MRKLVLTIALVLVCVPAFAQAPPGTGAYTFQGQGNLPAIISSLSNPLINQIPIGNGQNGYSLVQPNGDFGPGPNGPLGTYWVSGNHYGVQTCSAATCTPVSTVVLCNAASNPVTVQLPGAAGTGLFLWIQKTDGSPNPCIIAASGSDKIGGNANVVLNTSGQALLLDDIGSQAWSGNVVLPAQAGNTNAGGFPLTAVANANGRTIINLVNLGLISLTAPTPVCSATCTGGCGTTYTYQITARTDNGAEAPSSTVTCINNASLSGVNFNTLSWKLNPNQFSTGIYGRLANSLGFLGICSGTSGPCTLLSYKDTGSLAPGQPPPSYNHTGTLTGNGILGAGSFQTVTLTGMGSGTTYAPITGVGAVGLTEASIQQVVPVNSVFLDLRCSLPSAPGNTDTFTIRTNGVGNTSLGCSIINPATFCADTADTDAVFIPQGQLVDYIVSINAGTPAVGTCAIKVLE